ncbi:helix-turn-helix domain-containing protein [Bradyrhizobium sp. Pa8]|uniref:helix-turn-helix domain-containing protein n=1 Tax=Bradyrhizobium sp. Pa8 TaxID=3386552 RepID=UPI00403F06FE
MKSEVLPALVPKIFRFTDIDQYRTAVRNLKVEFTPLVRKISAEQVILSLPGCDINFARSFPRIADGQLAENCTAIGFSMDEGVPIRFNGADRDRSAIVIGRSSAVYSTVERTERQFTSIIFTPEIQKRGWPKAGQSWKVFETSALAQHRLRELVRLVLSVSSTFNGYEAADASAAIRESLLAGVDAAFAQVVDARWATRANSVKQFKMFRDIQDVLSANIARPIYSEELAKQLGISVRSMHDAVQRYQGMSLHRCLRLRRLWLVRQRLLAGADSVKMCALAFGFWHLGEFARSFRLHFGETPSDTLVKSRQR